MDIAYILFKPVANPPWWMKFLRNGMYHCSCIQSCVIGETRYYVLVENCFNYMSINACFLTLEQLLDAVDSENMTIIRYEYEVDPLQRMPYYEPISCVTVIKRLIGMSDWKVQTPYQLYKKLIRNGGTIWDNYLVAAVEIQQQANV